MGQSDPDAVAHSDERATLRRECPSSSGSLRVMGSGGIPTSIPWFLILTYKSTYHTVHSTL